MHDATATMGTVLMPGTMGKDAVHVAVVACEASTNLEVGAAVAISHRDADAPLAFIANRKDSIGIVDPFIDDRFIKAGQRFWLYLFPRTITGLRHVWTHPAFDGVSDGSYASPSQRLASEKWLKDWCRANDCPSYGTVLGRVLEWIDEGKDNVDFLYFYGQDAHAEIPPEFWVHMSVVTGHTIVGHDLPKYFQCSC